MTIGKLKAGLWVQARIRQCDLDGIPVVVSRRGDADAGAILVKLVRGRSECLVYTQFRTLDGVMTWVSAIGDEPTDEATVDAFITRQVERDRDLWVIEIEDHRGNFQIGDGG